MVGTRDGLSPADYGVDGGVHLPRGCPVILDAATLSLFCNPAIEVREPLVKERIEIPLDRTVRIQLDEEIVANNRRNIEPLPHSLCRRHVVTGNLTCLDARHKPAAKAHRHRAGNHQEIALMTTACRCFQPMIERSRSIVGVIRAPINLVHDPPLCRRRNRRHREIGVAAELVQQRNLSVQAAPLAVWPRVVERPVSMNEAEDRAAVLLPQQPMVLGETFTVLANLFDEALTVLLIMVKVNLDIAYAGADHLRDTV